MMELESGTFSASGIPEPVTATFAGPGSWTQGGTSKPMELPSYTTAARVHNTTYYNS